MNVVYILQGSKGLGKIIAFIWRKSCQIDTEGSFTVCKHFWAPGTFFQYFEFLKPTYQKATLKKIP